MQCATEVPRHLSLPRLVFYGAKASETNRSDFVKDEDFLPVGLLKIRFTSLAGVRQGRRDMQLQTLDMPAHSCPAVPCRALPARRTPDPFSSLPFLCRIDGTVRYRSGLEKDTEGYLGLAEKWFVFSMIWSVMAAADEDGRAKLDAFLRDVEVSEISLHCGVAYMIAVENTGPFSSNRSERGYCAESAMDLTKGPFSVRSGVWRVYASLVKPGRLCHPPLDISQPQFPPSASVYDYYVDPKKLDWEPWEPKVPPFRYLKTMPFHKMIVPTVDTVSEHVACGPDRVA